jgi:hypothetical protein
LKPVQIALLVVAGAVGGAIVMKVTERPQPAAPAPAVSQNAAENQAPAAVPATTAPAEPVERPSPLSERRAGSPARATRRTPPRDAEPVAILNSAPPAPVTPPPPAPSPEFAPPAPAHTENVTPAPDSAPPPATPPPPPPRQVSLNAGMLIPVRLIDGLTSERNNTGDTFTGSLDAALVVDGLVIAERGARVEGRVVSADKGGKVKGVATLAVQLTRIHLSDGQAVSVQSDSFEKHAEQTRGTDAAKVGGAAAIGAIIGAIAGGGKGAAIGAGAGGGVGAGDVLLTRGKPAVLPSETRISFRLSTPVTITERRS